MLYLRFLKDIQGKRVIYTHLKNQKRGLGWPIKSRILDKRMAFKTLEKEPQIERFQLAKIGRGKAGKDVSGSSQQSQKGGVAPWKCVKDEEEIDCVEICWGGMQIKSG